MPLTPSLALLPFAALLVVWALLARRRGGWLDAWPYAGLLLGAWLALSTEGLGALHGLNPVDASLAWLLALLCAVLAHRRLGQGPLPSVRLPSGRLDRLIWFVVLATALATLVLGLASAPNDPDAVQYHLTRVAHWIQQGDLRPWPTADPRQLEYPPLGEYANLHLQLLWGSDRLSSLPQWSAYLGCIALAARLARGFGGSDRAQAIAALAVAWMPQALLQSMVAENDVMTAFWLMAAAAFILDGAGEAAGLALGLALLTKGTAYLLGLPLGLWLVVRLLRGRRWRTLGLAIGLALLPSVGHWARVTSVFGAPVHDTSGTLTGRVGVRECLATLPKHVLLQFSLPAPALNRAAFGAVLAWQRLLGVDPEDRRLNYELNSWEDFGTVPPTRANVAYAGNFWHLLAASLALGWVWMRRRGRPEAAYACAAVAGWILLMAFLRWQPFGARLQFPFLALCAPLIGVMLEQVPWLATGLGLAAAAAAAPLLWSNECLPWRGEGAFWKKERMEQYFSQGMVVWPRPAAAAAVLLEHRYPSVGLDFQGFEWEYPLFELVKGGDEAGGPWMQAVPTRDRPWQFADTPLSRDFRPAAILKVHANAVDRKPPAADGAWTLVWEDPQGGFFQVWERADAGAQAPKP